MHARGITAWFAGVVLDTVPISDEVVVAVLPPRTFLTAVPGLDHCGGSGGGLSGSVDFGGWWVSNHEHAKLQWASLVSFLMTLLLFSSKLKLLFWWNISAWSGSVNGLLSIIKLVLHVMCGLPAPLAPSHR